MKPNPNAVSSSIVTRNIADITGDNGNVYEAISVISKRANQLSVKLKEELNDKLAEFASTVDNLEEVFENREQIEVSKQYERMPKPTSLAIEEFLQGKIYYSTPEPEEVQIPRELF
ncbi:DNA-directed RNA polymerase subunit omega [Hymenobacter monticola]|uniref:DNA-directed RNA polymerase subunit omega n=1 Tax=Hymenobacter monticola TaxID=1705399 RepID=A0ABY4AYH9_9BACT|nr:DNA-directed RNA polymerase subunit omega [Hymenobacter monticola]UOE31909.1 DNA-directed RNA polymerase subunit omega [Hymenobacter monticola]